MCGYWEAASHKLTPFEKVPIDVDYKKTKHTYDVWTHSIWEWSLDILQNPDLEPYFVWDAEKLFKFNGEDFIQFIDEPWTGSQWWKIQSQLPNPEGKPLCYILYADKSKLSTFGSQVGYFVIARCANLPTWIRNGEGIGGGRVVGWIPIVEEEQQHKGKKSFVDFKRVVWHKSFLKYLESLRPYAKTGFWFQTSQGEKLCLFPLVIILSADYEEQCVMALTRGFGGLCPCPVCTIDKDKLSDLTVQASHRTALDVLELSEIADSLSLASEREGLYKEEGLRNVENAFFSIPFSDPYDALSFDRLHANAEGNFGKHLYPTLQGCIKDINREACQLVDSQMSQIPPWRNLNHFKAIMDIHFSDGSKYEDISKQNKSAYLLLCCLRIYLVIDMYAALEVHTETTLLAGEEALRKFDLLMKKYIASCAEDDKPKDWNFPKYHALKHLFQDIRAKGCTRNYNTKPNEKCHVPFKKAYQRQTNKKEVEGQLLRLDHWSVVSAYIKDRIKSLDDFIKSQEDEESENGPNDITQHIILGSPDPSTTFSNLEALYSSNSAFRNFRKKLNNFLNIFLPALSIPLPDNRKIHFNPDDKITRCKFLKVNYESMVSWEICTDLLRCNPNFQEKPRYDYIMVDTGQGHIYAQLLYMFKCTVGDNSYPLALIHPYDAGIPGPRRRKDKDLELRRIRPKPQIESEFISLHSVIRGALVVSDFETNTDYFVVDTLDTDMFLRLRPETISM
ncbi:hypothetical protein QCA50_004569 [Cerrena zonata]|uniref:Uncharacterized protein n=1 Tax=Cerrena zonata TaxID=2478898 RepID=A0AAW0GPE4_9APHY